MKEKKEEKKKKTKAFTLIELLATITILAILILVAIPAISRVIYNSRRDVYVNTVKTYTKELHKKVVNGELEVQNTDTTYYIPMDYIELENEAKSPFGNFKDGYAIISYDGQKYHYYWTSTDTANMGINFTAYNILKRNAVVPNIENISTDISICGKPKIVIFDKNGNIMEQKTTQNCYSETNNQIEEIKTYLCKRATTLHEEQCSQTNTNGYYCSSASLGSKKITYGNLGTVGTLTPGDAFDCDVNSDDIYNPITERFYYVSPKDANPSSNYVTLIYYSNVSMGIPDNISAYAYSSVQVEGPTVAYQQLPSTEQWKNPKLVNNMSRQIKTGNGKTTVTYDYEDFNLPVFTYTNKAARLLTYNELRSACGTTGNTNTIGYLDSCRYLMENTTYSSNSNRNNGFFLENWIGGTVNGGNKNVYTTFPTRTLSGASCSFANTIGVRPAIEVLKTDIEY